MGLMLLGCSVGMAIIGGQFFNTSEQISVNAVILQPGDLSRDRLPTPVSLDKIDDDFIRENLIKKFVYEYFYAVPDTENITQRMRGDGTLARMCNSEVFSQWLKNTAPKIQELSSGNILRHIHINSVSLPADSIYYVIDYDIETFSASNDVLRAPYVMRNNIMTLNISYEHGIIEKFANGTEFDVKQYLENGGDPANIFKFRVNEVRINE
jgi:hypothetical protein